MNDDQVLDALKGYARVAPGFVKWRDNHIRTLVRANNSTIPEEVAFFRRCWQLALKDYSLEEVQAVLDDMAVGNVERGFYGYAHATIAAECKRRRGQKPDQRWKEPLEKDRGPTLTPEEFKSMKAELNEILGKGKSSAVSVTSAADDQHLLEAPRNWGEGDSVRDDSGEDVQEGGERDPPF